MSGGVLGFRAWLLQRLSAMFLVIGSLLLISLMLCPPEGGFEGWRDWMASPFTIIVIGLFAIALVLHAWVGMRDVILDYVRPLGLRLLLLTGLATYLLGSLFWLLWILL